jgi:hypothetical protein
MKRREFISLLGGAAAAWPLGARAAVGGAGDRIPRQRVPPRVGVASRRCGDKCAYRFALVSAGGRMVAAGRQPGKRSSAVSGRTASTAPAREKSCKARTRSSGSPIHPAVPVSGALQI